MASFFPESYISLSYSQIYDDYGTFDIHKALSGVPSLCVLNHVIGLQNEALYALGNARLQLKLVNDFKLYLSSRTNKRINQVVRKHKGKISFLDASTCFYTFALVLQHFKAAESGDTELDLCQDEYETVFKVLLYCNQRWTDEQVDGINDSHNLTELAIRIDLPVVEFKYYKDFRAQIYKAIQLFKFCEKDKYYSNILSSFCIDNHVSTWHDYIGKIFSFYMSSLQSHFIFIDENDIDTHNFLGQFSIELKDCSDLWTGYNAITYFRDHFLLKLSNTTYLLLNANLLIDKIYQGLKFMFADTVRAHNLPNKKGKPYKSETLKQDFLSQLGEDYSEPYLMYTLMMGIFKDRSDIFYQGEFLKSKEVPAEPDYYLRIGNVLYLFEHKDLALGNPYRYSHDYENTIKPAILDRICRYTDKKHKGFGQLYNSIENIFLKGSMDALDSGVQNVKTVVPIILTTDRAFSSIGIQRLLIEESLTIVREHPINKNIFISQPIVLDIDTLVLCGNRLKKGMYNLDEMVSSYLQMNKLNLSPFNTFVMDNYLNKDLYTMEDIQFITNGIV